MSTPVTGEAPPDELPIRVGWPAAAWIVFDFGYSLFAFVVFARYLGDWLINDLGRPDYYYTNTQALTALVLLVAMPAAGVVADRIRRHVPLLLTFTLLACVSAVGIGVVPVGDGLRGTLGVLVLGGLCAASTSLAFAQFDPLLARVAPPARWGSVSGGAVAAGYVGIILSLGLFGTLIVGDGDKQRAFAPAALVFLLFALPAFRLIRERAVHAGGATVEPLPRAIWSAVRGLRGSLRRLGRHPGVLRLLAGRFLYTDAVGTINIYFIVYMSRSGHFTEREKDLAILVAVTFAGIGGLIAGRLVRRLGPRRTLLLIIPGFTLGIGVTAVTGAPWSVWLLAPVVGTALGTVHATDRVFMLTLAPASARGEMFGFFNLIGRVGQALGPFVLWGGVIWLLHDRTGWLSAFDASRVSLVLLALTALAGLLVIRTIDDGHEASRHADSSTGPSPR